MRVERHPHDRQPLIAAEAGLRAGELDGPADDALMAAVHAIEHTNGDDGRTPVVRHLVQAVPAAHAALLPTIIGGWPRSPPWPRPPRVPCAGGGRDRGDGAGRHPSYGTKTASDRAWPPSSRMSAMSSPSGPKTAAGPPDAASGRAFSSSPAGSRAPWATRD